MLRNLFLALLLANLLVWAWQRWVVPPEAADALALQASREPELVLLSRAPARLAEGAAGTCLRVGPFAEAVAVRAAQQQVRNRGLPVTVEGEAVEIWVGHWVQVPGLSDRGTANAARDALVAAGLADAYVVRADGGFKISLGVFRERDRADRVARIARGAGFDAVTADRTRDGEEYWLQVGPMAGASLDLAGLEPAADRILRSETGACPGPPPDSGPAPDSLESAAAAGSTPE